MGTQLKNVNPLKIPQNTKREGRESVMQRIKREENEREN